MALTQEKAERIAQEYEKTSFLNKSLALLNTGYQRTYAFSGIGHKLYKNIRVIEAINTIRAKIAKKFEVTEIEQTERILDNYTRSKVLNDRRTELTALDMLNRRIGYYGLDNAQKASDVRTFNITQVKALIIDNDKRDKEILEIEEGLAE